MTCIRCGNTVSVSAKFCGGCGARVAELRPAGLPPTGLPPSFSPPSHGGLHATQLPAARRGGLGIALVCVAVLVGGGLLYHASQIKPGETNGHGLFLTNERTGESFALITEEGRTVFSSAAEDWTPDFNMFTTALERGVGSVPLIHAWGNMTLSNAAHQVVFIDEYGKRTDNPLAVPIGDFSEGLAAAVPQGTSGRSPCGYIDRSHRLVVPAIYLSCGAFSGGLAQITVNGRAGYVDKTGRIAITPQYRTVNAFHEDRACVTTIDNQSIVIDTTGKSLFTVHKCEEVYFSDHRAATGQNGRWGYMDPTGRVVIPMKYNTVDVVFHEGLAFARDDTGQFVIDVNGGETRVPDLAAHTEFHDGLAAVRVPTGVGLMDRQGHMKAAATYASMTWDGLWRASIKDDQPPDFLDEHGMVFTPRTQGKCLFYDHGVFTCAAGTDSAGGLVYVTRSGRRIGEFYLK